MKSLISVLFVLFIGHVAVEKIVGGDPVQGYFNGDTADGLTNSYMISNSSCDPEIFERKSSCTLSCKVRCEGNVKDIKPVWIYKSNINSTGSYSITDGTSMTSSSNNYTLNLTLEDYRSGVYIAQFSCSDSSLSCPFQFSDVEGVPLNGTCTDSTNCTTLHAECDDSICICPSEYPVHKESPDTCLPVATAGSQCEYDEQCIDGDMHLKCQTICTCADYLSYLKYVEEEDRMMCIRPEQYDEACDYDEECMLWDINMECDSRGYCDCQYGYYYDSLYGFCLYNPWTAYLSVTAVIGIVFGVILLVVLALTGFALCLRPKRRVPPVPPTTIDNEFASFYEPSPSVMWSARQQTAHPSDVPPDYTEAGGLDSPPPPFESEIVIKTRLEDPPPMENMNNNNPFQQVALQQPQQFSQPNQPSQVQQQQLDLYTPRSAPSSTAQQQLNSNDMFFFQNPNYQTNLGFEEDC